MNYPKSFLDLVECFKRLPGIGGKSAERLAYYVLSMDKEYVQEFAHTLMNFQDNIHYCKNRLTKLIEFYNTTRWCHKYFTIY